MRGDELTRQWCIIRAIAANPNGLIVTELANREGMGGNIIDKIGKFEDIFSCKNARELTKTLYEEKG